MTGCSVLDNVVTVARKNGKRLPCERLQAENKNLIANYEMLSASYMDSRRVCEHLFIELKRYKSLIRAKLPKRELMLIDETKKLRELCAELYPYVGDPCPDTCKYREKCKSESNRGTDGFPLMCVAYNELFEKLRELGIEVPE